MSEVDAEPEAHETAEIGAGNAMKPAEESPAEGSPAGTLLDGEHGHLDGNEDDPDEGRGDRGGDDGGDALGAQGDIDGAQGDLDGAQGDIDGERGDLAGEADREEEQAHFDGGEGDLEAEQAGAAVEGGELATPELELVEATPAPDFEEATPAAGFEEVTPDFEEATPAPGFEEVTPDLEDVTPDFEQSASQPGGSLATGSGTEPGTSQLVFVDVLIVLPSSNPVVVLQEADSPYRELRIPIGGPEGIAIGYAARRIATPRPLTHELMSALLRDFDLTLEVVRITGSSGGSFTAEIVVSGPVGARTIDCRPSDAIALALRQRLPVPIVASWAVLDQAGSGAAGSN